MKRLFKWAVTVGMVWIGVHGRADEGNLPISPADRNDQAFRGWVEDWARRNAKECAINAWWSANLDDDPSPERIARLCPSQPPSGGEESPYSYLLIEDEPGHRWSLQFAVARGEECDMASTGQPNADRSRFQRTHETTISTNRPRTKATLRRSKHSRQDSI